RPSERYLISVVVSRRLHRRRRPRPDHAGRRRASAITVELGYMHLPRHARALLAAPLVVAITVIAASPALAAPEDQVTWAAHISIAPTWFDPAETPGIGTPFMILYALHDALVKPMPGHAMTPSLAESWSVSKDGLVYELVLRQGARFHNGDPGTADDVKLSFER